MERQNLVGYSTGLGRVTVLAPTTIALAARMSPADNAPKLPSRPGSSIMATRSVSWARQNAVAFVALGPIMATLMAVPVLGE